MKASFLPFLIVLLILAGPIEAQTDCNQVEFDVFSVNNNNQSLYNIAQLLTPGAGANGISFSGVDYPLPLARPITNGIVSVEIVLSPNQGFLPTILANGSIVNVYFTIIPDSITLSLNGGLQQVQRFNTLGNNFTFYNFLGTGAFQVLNNLSVSVVQNSTAQSATASCTSAYTITIINPAFVNVTVTGDPQFVGLRGQTYQVHGIDGSVYNIISDHDLQLNSRFIYLSGPRSCPIIPSTGEKAAACWTHNGSYLGQIGLKYEGNKVFIQPGEAKVGFAIVIMNGEAMKVGSSNDIVRYNNSHEITLEFGDWVIELENSDSFVNLRLVKLLSSTWSRLSAHGLLGQTWSTKQHKGKISAIEGEVEDYMIEEDTVFGDTFLFNKFVNQ